MEEEPRTIEQREHYEGEIEMALQGQPEILPSTEFVKVEKNLASLGFFTPSSKRLRNAQEKSFTITTFVEGKRIESKGTIIPSAKYGLPITADQDKWIALCKILTDIMRKEGRVTNPVAFTSAEILRLLRKHRHSGKNYREVEEWLDVLFSTTIFSEGVVYLANEKRRVKDRFRVFERAVSFGKELPDGKVADKNYVWFSDWQLQNINANHLLPIDLEAYRELKNHIAKALVPLLQVWLYATREEGVFEKRYDELCQMLNIRQYPYHSLITRTLAPSLDELKQFGYLADWRIQKTTDGENYKIAFYHGAKFHRDRRSRLSRKGASNNSIERDREIRDTDGSPSAGMKRSTPRQANERRSRPAPAINEAFLAELIQRGVTENHGQKILAEISADQPVLAQLEWGDLQVQQARGKITNPAGFYISLVSGNVTPPPGFETKSQRKVREDEERRREDERLFEQELETEYEWYRNRETDRFIAALDPADVAAVLEAKRHECREKYTSLSDETIDRFAHQKSRRELQKRVPLMPLEEFKASRSAATDLFSKPVPEPVVSEVQAIASEPVLPPINTGNQNSDETPAALDEQGEGRGPIAEQSAEPPITPIMSVPVIELVSEPPLPEAFGGDSIEPSHLA